jgi:hypothetical protein
MRRWTFASALALLAVVSTAGPASAAPPTVANAFCEQSPPQRGSGGGPNIGTRMGPVGFAGWDGYATWANMESQRDPRTGTNYAKSPMWVRRGAVASLYVAPAYRAVADFNYGARRSGSHRLSDVVRIRACPDRLSFYSGGLVIREATCVEIRVRVRGNRRVYRKMVSINKGDACPAVPRRG